MAPESVKIVGLGVLAAAAYGVAHDLITAHVCLEYFTVAHRDLVGHDPNVIALYWGVVATWWVGLPLGVLLALAARAGPRQPVTARSVAPRIALLIAGLLVLAMVAGLVGYARAAAGAAWLPECFRNQIPPDHANGFGFDRWAHETSYVGGFVGGLALCASTYLRRALAPNAQPRRPSDAAIAIGCLAGALAPLLYLAVVLMAMQYEDVSAGRFGAPFSIDDMGISFFLLVYSAPWLEAFMVLWGLVGLATLARRWTTSSAEPG